MCLATFFAVVSILVSSIPSLSLNSLLGTVFNLNITHPSDHSHLCSLKCHLTDNLTSCTTCKLSVHIINCIYNIAYVILAHSAVTDLNFGPSIYFPTYSGRFHFTDQLDKTLSRQIRLLTEQFLLQLGIVSFQQIHLTC